MMSAMLDGFAIQIALTDPVVDAETRLCDIDEIRVRPARLRVVPEANVEVAGCRPAAQA